MPQVSRPLLIALIAVVGFAGAWMTVLKKHPSSAAPPPTAPGAAGLGRAITHAKDTVATANHAAGLSNVRNAHVGSPTTVAPAAAAPAPAAPEPAAAAPGKTTVLLFAGRGADDAAARAVVRSIHGPRLRTVVASLSAVPRYARLLGGVPVTAAPAIFVIGADHTAQQIVGLPDRDQVLQAVAERSAGK
jgi:hypothetical protein